MGGDGCWDGMRSDANSSNKFAAVAPIAGKGMNSEGCTAGERAITVWAFHSDSDTSTTIQSHLQAINGYNDCKSSDTPAVIFTEYSGISHARTWQNAYRTDNTLHTPNLYEWFLSQRKTSSILSVSENEIKIKKELQFGDKVYIYSIEGKFIEEVVVKEERDLFDLVLKKTNTATKQLYFLQVIQKDNKTTVFKMFF